MKKIEITPKPTDHEADAMAALAHMGAGNLLGSAKDGLFGASIPLSSVDRLDPDRDAAKVRRYQKHMERGHKAIEASTGHVYGSAFPGTDNDHKPLKEFMDAGGLATQFNNTQGNTYDASDPIANAYPEQNLLLNDAKGGVYNYLNSLKPTQQPQKLMFDRDPGQELQERRYSQALKLAANPLNIMKQIRKGSLTPDTVKDFTSMYPGLYNHLSKKITERLTVEALNGDKKPPYRVRQALSLFLGTPLDTTLTQPSIAAAQASYAAQKASQPQPQPPKKSKKSSQSLDKTSQSYLTGSQAAEKRQQTDKP